MKKLILLAAFAVFSLTTIEAQEISFGLKAGANFASVNGDDADNLDGRTSLHGGAVFNIGLSELIAIQPEVLFSSQGYSFNDEDGDNDVVLDYINIPILVDVTLADGFSLQGGPQVGINVGSKLKFLDEEIDLKDGTESLDLSAAIGAQYRLPMGVFFQARYAIGFTNISTEEDVDAKNSVVSLSVGWFFN
ncbi:MAG: PorT family protein [Altibacter sp.]|nr:PorT family protein [Altibacter sp.]